MPLLWSWGILTISKISSYTYAAPPALPRGSQRSPTQSRQMIFTAETRRRGENAGWKKAPGSGAWRPVPVAGAGPIFAAWRLCVIKLGSLAPTGASPTKSKQLLFFEGAGNEARTSTATGGISEIASAAASDHGDLPLPVRQPGKPAPGEFVVLFIPGTGSLQKAQYGC